MRTLLLVGLSFALAGGQFPDERNTRHRTLPGGKNQTEEILKADHQHSLEDATEMIRLSELLKAELERNDHHVVSMASIKRTEQIEKLARRIRARMRRF